MSQTSAPPHWQVGVLSSARLHADALSAAVHRRGWSAKDPTLGEALADTDVVVFDAHSRVTLARAFAASSPEVPVVLWGPATTPSAALIHPSGYVSEARTSVQLCDQVASVAKGMRAVRRVADAAPRLTPREREVARAYFIEQPEATRRQVAVALGISESTLKAHLHNIREAVPHGHSMSRVGLRTALRPYLSEPSSSPSAGDRGVVPLG